MATLCIIINNVIMCVLKASLPPSNVSMYPVDIFYGNGFPDNYIFIIFRSCAAGRDLCRRYQDRPRQGVCDYRQA